MCGVCVYVVILLLLFMCLMLIVLMWNVVSDLWCVMLMIVVFGSCLVNR